MSDDDILIDAKLAKASYNQAPEVDGWKRDTQLSNINRSVYTKDGKAKVAFRGTDLSNKHTWADDIGTDILLGLGLQDKSSRLKNAKVTTDKAVQKYGKENVSLTGHSLGGSTTAYVSRATGLKGTGFNAAFSPIDALRKRTYSNFNNVTSDGDIVSSIGRKLSRMRQTRMPARSKNAHSLRNFI